MTTRLIKHYAMLDASRIAATARRVGFGASLLGAGLLGLGLAVGVMTPLTALLAPTEAVAQERDADYSQFYDQLEEHGRWMDHPRWGYVWLPNADDGNWRPYTIGNWVNTEEHGWYWNSDEPWGWATYHYGRWVREEEEGWVWIPGREWAPAWVAWREGDEYIGWAPLPPEAEWEPGSGSLSFASSYYDSPRYEPYWIFVRPMHMVGSGLHRHIIPRSRASYVLRNTTYVTNYSFVDRRVYNRGIRVNLVERGLNRSLPPVRIVSTDNHRDHGFKSHGGEHRGEQRSGPSTGAVVAGVAAGVVALGVLNVFRPKLAPKNAGGPPPAPRNYLPQAGGRNSGGRDAGGRGPEGRPVARPTSGLPSALPSAGRSTGPVPGAPASGGMFGGGNPGNPGNLGNASGQPSIMRPPRTIEGQPRQVTPPPAAVSQPQAQPSVGSRPTGSGGMFQGGSAKPAPTALPPVFQRPAPPTPPPVVQRAAPPPPQPRAVQPPPQQPRPAQPAAQPRPQPPAGAPPQGQGRGQGQGQGGQKRNPNDPNQPPPR
jgi:hypothetical protein